MRAASLLSRLFAVCCIAPILALAARNEFGVPEVARSINAFGLDLYREQVKTSGGGNVLLSPYSISSALAMTYMGAAGETKAEMHKVLRLPADQSVCGEAFQLLAEQLSRAASTPEIEAARRKSEGDDSTPIQLAIANRLFIQSGFNVRPEFIEQVGRHFDSEVSLLNFKGESGRARSEINKWVAERTHDRIRDLLPIGQPDPDTKLALLNAIYLRAAWATIFEESSTIPERFHIDRRQAVPVPTMRATRSMRYAERNGYTIVTLPYIGHQLQFVLIVPDSVDGLSRVEDSMTVQVLEGLRNLKVRRVNLHLPRFKLEPDVVSLEQTLQGLGMRTAFDRPEGSANFDGIAPRTPNEYLYVGPVMHKAWLSLDESGTEAAAATAVMMVSSVGVWNPPPPVEVRADRPFMFAIQHVESGACLFLGRVTDPR